MTHQVIRQDPASACPVAPLGRRFFGAGLRFGLLGGICCIGSAVATGAGLSGLSFFSTWMTHYQPYFIVASILLMTLWLVRQVPRHARGGRGALTAFVRGSWRQLVIMGVVYALMLGVAMAMVAATRM